MAPITVRRDRARITIVNIISVGMFVLTRVFSSKSISQRNVKGMPFPL